MKLVYKNSELRSSHTHTAITMGTIIAVRRNNQKRDYSRSIMPEFSSYENREEVDGYSYGFNGMEKDDEVKGEGNSYTTEFRQYDPRLGRCWNLDPKYTGSESRYVVNGNNPIVYIDPLGDFKTKFGARLYKWRHGGEIKQDKGSGDWFGDERSASGILFGSAATFENAILQEMGLFIRATYSITFGGDKIIPYLRPSQDAKIILDRFKSAGVDYKFPQTINYTRITPDKPNENDTDRDYKEYPKED